MGSCVSTKKPDRGVKNQVVGRESQYLTGAEKVIMRNSIVGELNLFFKVRIQNLKIKNLQMVIYDLFSTTLL